MKSNWRKSCGGLWCVGAALVLAAVTVSLTPAQQPARNVSKEAARLSRDWVRDGVIYQVYERDFSPEGTFNGVTAQLDRLKDLGVTILWLMPVHPIGQEKKKGSIGSPYAVRDYYAMNSDYGTKDDMKRLISEAHKADLLVKAFDLDYSWPLHGTLTDVLQGRGGASDLRRSWEEEAREWPRGSLHLRFSDNHDERRAIARFGEPGALAASALMFTLDGVPLIYNGMEVGDTTESGAPALFEKMPIFWPISERRPEFPRFYKQMVALRRSSSALRRGSLDWLRNSDESRVVTYLRRSSDEEVLVALNFSNRPFFGSVEIGSSDAYREITPYVGSPQPPDAPASANVGAKRAAGLPAISLDAWGYRIFRRALG